VYHDANEDQPHVDVLTPGGLPARQQPTRSTQKPIYHKGLLKGDPKKLLLDLSGQSTQERLSLNQELNVARAMLLQLQQSVLPPEPDPNAAPGATVPPVVVPDSFYADVTRLLDVIGKLSERSQPKSTLTVNNVQTVLMKVVDVVASEVNDPLILERIINKLSSVVLVQK